MIGINLAKVAPWSPEIPFVNPFKTSRWAWSIKGFPQIVEGLDERGWIEALQPPEPGVKAVALLFEGMDKDSPRSGRWICHYEGEGEITYRLGARKIAGESIPGRDVIQVGLATVFIEITSLKENPIRNIWLEKEGQPAGLGFFNPDFLEVIKPFKVIRFMDWQKINDSTQKEWSDRPVPQDAQWTIKGAPLEVMVSLVNRLDVDPWFNMPHMATDDYVLNFAEYIRDNLGLGRKVYIEYTNEDWNSIFPQSAWIEEQAKSEGVKRFEWFARRTAQIINICKEVLGNRVIGVLATQAAWPGLGRSTIDFLRRTGGFCSIDAIAIAPYFGHYLGDPRFLEQTEKMTLDEMFQELTDGKILNLQGKPIAPQGALKIAYRNMDAYSKLCQENGKALVAYEGGQHLAGFGRARSSKRLMDLFVAANRDPRMGEIYQEYLQYWRKAGGGVFCHFNSVTRPTGSGSWGAMENLLDRENPKYRALLGAL